MIYKSPEEELTKGYITEVRKKLENNDLFKKFVKDETININAYRHNEQYIGDDDMPDHMKLKNAKKDDCLEAICAAIYLDGGIGAAEEWIIDWLLPRLKKICSLLKCVVILNWEKSMLDSKIIFTGDVKENEYEEDYLLPKFETQKSDDFSSPVNLNYFLN